MTKLGFEEFLDPSHKGYIITSYKFPSDKNFNFQQFYTKLNERGKLDKCRIRILKIIHILMMHAVFGHLI